MRIFAVLGILVLAGAPLSAQDPPPFRAGVDLFEFEVSVLDRDRRPVRGLTAADFTVLEEGTAQRIVGFSEVTLPEADGPLTAAAEDVAPDVASIRYADRRLIAVVLDDFDLRDNIDSIRVIADVRDVAKGIVDRLGPLDLAAVVLSRGTRYFADFSNDRWKLLEPVNAVRAPMEAERAYLQLMMRGRIGGLFALQEVVRQLATLPQHRKVVIYVSRGLGGQRIAGAARDRMVDIARAAHEAGIVISAIDPSGLTVRRPRGEDLLGTLARLTGGFAAVGTNDFRAAVTQIFRETQSYYLIGYERTGPDDGKFRKLEVRVHRPGVTAHARSGRHAPPPDDLVKGSATPFDAEVNAAVELLDRTGGEGLLGSFGVLAEGSVLGPPSVFRAGSSPRAPLLPAEDLRFARTERLRLEFPLLKPVREHRARLLRRSGEALDVPVEFSEQTPDRQALLVGGFALSFLAPGDYIVELVAESGEDSERRLVAFRVR